MTVNLTTTTLASALCLIAILSLIASPRVRTVSGFFHGVDDQGAAPGLWTLVLSQVTTWIFARSLLNAALLGYAFGIAGALGYTAYYLSFLTGGVIVDRIRFRRGHSSIQNFMREEYGAFGVATFNFLIALRLVSEVFANLLVVGIIFGATGSSNYYIAIAFVTLITLAYSLIGGLRASLRTDVVQMLLFIAVLVAVMAILMFRPDFSVSAALASSPQVNSPGWVLLAVALLQVISYPMHDPVMMDRGWLADRTTSWMSFIHAFWLSALCILAFGMIGVYAGLHKMSGEAMMQTFERLFDWPTLMLINIALLVSAMSTLDSALASAAKLAIVDMKLGSENVRNGRIAMVAFTLAGILLLLTGSKDLYAAVAISGTAAMFLTPVILFNLIGGWRAPLWSYQIAFALAITGAVIYFLDSSGYTKIVAALFGPLHNYTVLLVINAAIFLFSCLAFAIGVARTNKPGA